jgi:VTC domain
VNKLSLVWSAPRNGKAEGAADARGPAAAPIVPPILDLPAREIDRYELKYWVPTALTSEVLDFARPYLVLDPFNVRLGLERQYNTTLYLETPRLDSYWTHIDAAADRYKLRVRAYGEVPEGLAFFETKRKMNAITVKTRTAVAMSDVAPLLDGTYDALPTRLQPDERRHLEHFLYRRTMTDARPCVLVRAHRESYCTPDPREDVRLTFDREICFQPARGASLFGDPRAWVPIDGEEQHGKHGAHTMIELKFPRLAPLWMGRLIDRLDMWRVGYSKYIAAVQSLLDKPMLDAVAWDLAGEND